MMEVEERIYWEERRRYEEELEYYEWCRRHHNVPHPRGMPIPPPLPGHPYGPPVGPPLMPPPPPSVSVDLFFIAQERKRLFENVETKFILPFNTMPFI